MTGRRLLIAAAWLGVALGACSSSSKSPPQTTAAPQHTAAPTTAAPAPTAATAGPTLTTEVETTVPVPPQTETITPDTGLTDGQVVTVIGKGFTPGAQVSLTECADKGTATTADDCNLDGVKIATAGPTGTVTAQFPVAKGPFGGNHIVCSASQKCLVSIANAGAGSGTEVATRDISFTS